MRVTRLGRGWAAVVVFPLAVAQAYGLTWEADINTLTLFRIQASWAPLWIWGLMWAVVAVLSFIAFCCARPWALRWSAILGAGAAAGTFVASIWTRWGEGRPLTWVGLSWSYVIMAGFIMIMASLMAHPLSWLEDER